ncbi:hypothetical protein F5Y09DRAFT_132382 [Xylaria sp. FL1042]|nr:hypothetical protein F5Y09DRAFT_132382 [Xylaria sp. FL1042]
MPRLPSRKDVARDIVNDNEIETRETGETTAIETQEVTSTRVISASQVKRGTPMTSMQDRTTSISVSQNMWPWHGGWTPGVGPWPGQRGGTPTAVVTLASTVTYTQPHPTAKASQSSSQEPTASRARFNGLDISGPAAAGIGVGASVGLLGLCLAVIFFYRIRSRRSKHQSAAKASGSDKTSDDIWPPYLYSASNEAPVELSAIRQPKEMCAGTRSREKNVSNHSEIVELDGGGPVIR